MTKRASKPIPPLPRNEMPGQLNLNWPSTVPYVQCNESVPKSAEKQATVPKHKLRESMQLKQMSSPLTELKSAKRKSVSQMDGSPMYGKGLSTDQIRLICLAEADSSLPEDAVHVCLETYQDGESPEYEAVSYTWGGEDGDDSMHYPIYVGEYWDILLQSHNCCAMLRYLRPVRGNRMLWVDAVCINQQDIKERGDQVAKMDLIYSACFQVVLWLGDDIVSRRPGVYPPRYRFHQLESFDKLPLPTGDGSKSESLERVRIQDLLKRRYFSRVWIIQELILPPRVLIPIGNKLFWIDSAMSANLEHQTAGFWSWGKTQAPWLQYAAQGSLLSKCLPDIIGLTWKSQCSDLRDKIYGILGTLSLRPGITRIRPDYDISLQHMLLGFFAHCIINDGVPQLLFKASGVSADVGMPSWMPLWRGDDAWKRLFGNERENPSWRSVAGSLAEMKGHLVTTLRTRHRITLIGRNARYRLVRFLPSPALKANRPRTVFEVRPWYKNATVDADSGALSINLTRLTSVTRTLARVDPPRDGWYHYSVGIDSVMYMMSQSNLEAVVRVGDEIFLLDTDLSEPIYLILRKTGKDEEFRLIATCPHLAIFFMGFQPGTSSVEDVPLADLQTNLATDLTRLQGLLNEKVWSSGDFCPQILFPGAWKDLFLKDLMPLLLAAPNDGDENQVESWKRFEEAYLGFLDPKCQPQVIHGVCELVLDTEDANDIQDACSRTTAPFAGWEGWTKKGIAGDTGGTVLCRSIKIIKGELEHMMGISMIWREWEWLEPLLKLVGSIGVRDRVMEKPLAEDHFRGGTHYGCDEVFKTFQLDGSTYQVCIT